MQSVFYEKCTIEYYFFMQTQYVLYQIEEPNFLTITGKNVKLFQTSNGHHFDKLALTVYNCQPFSNFYQPRNLYIMKQHSDSLWD